MGYWPYISSLELADPEFNVSKLIDVLLGVDVYQDILQPGLILGPKGTPAAKEIIFGWVLFGGASSQQLPDEVSRLYASTSLPSSEEPFRNFGLLRNHAKPGYL